MAKHQKMSKNTMSHTLIKPKTKPKTSGTKCVNQQPVAFTKLVSFRFVFIQVHEVLGLAYSKKNMWAMESTGGWLRTVSSFHSL